MGVGFEEYRITQNDPNITLTGGTANLESTIAKFVCPDRTWFKIRPGDVFSLLAQSSGATSIAATSVVKLIRTDPNQRMKKLVLQVDYTAVVEFQDRNKIYTIGMPISLKPKSQLLLNVIADLAVSTSYLRFQLSCQMAYDLESETG